MLLCYQDPSCSCILISTIFSSLETHHKTSAHIPHTLPGSHPDARLRGRTLWVLCTQNAPKNGVSATGHSPDVHRDAKDVVRAAGRSPVIPGGLGSPRLPPSLRRSHSHRHRAVISHEPTLMAAQLQKPFFCPLEPNAEDNYGFVTDCDSEIERRRHTSLRAAQGPSAPGQLGF